MTVNETKLMREPLNQFAERIIRNDEVKEFIQGLIEKGVSPHAIKAATEPPPKPQEDFGRHRMDHGR